MKKIYLEGTPSTIRAMEWIRENGCPWVQDLAVHFSLGCRDGSFDMMISSMNECEVKDDLEFHPLDTWFDYKGMKRRHCDIPSWAWLFCIDGNYYFATI